MTGFYADVPGVRVPFHNDGSITKWAKNSSAASPMTITTAWTVIPDTTNSNNGTIDNSSISWAAANEGYVIATAFATPITLVGHRVMMGANIDPAGSAMTYSTDTTDGTDGVWNTLTPHSVSIGQPEGTIRSIQLCNIPNVKGIRVSSWATGTGRTISFSDVAYYAEWTPASLIAWNPTLNERLGGAGLDFGNTLLGLVYTKTFRVKNATAQTASGVLVSCTSGKAAVVNGLTFSTDNATFSTNITIPSIAPGGISPVIYVKRTVSPVEAVNVPGGAQINMTASSWT